MAASAVFAKTDQGVRALHAARDSMAAPARRLLILIDGKRDLDELAAMLGADTVQLWLPRLANDGLVRAVQRGAGPASAPASTAAPTARSDPASAAPRPAESLPGAAAPRGLSAAGLALRLALVCAAVAGIWWWYSGTAPEAAREAAADRPAPGAAPSAPPPPLPIVRAPAAAAPSAAPAAALPAGTGAESGALGRQARDAKERGAYAPRDGRAGAQAQLAQGPAGSREAAARAQAAAGPGTVAAPLADAPAPLPRATLPPPPPRVAAVEPADSAAAASAGDNAAPPASAAGAAGAAALAPGGGAAGPTAQRLHARNRPLPTIPRRAVRAGIDRGRIIVRLHVDAAGNVERVDLLRAEPPQMYDSTVQHALEGWTFDPPGRAAEQDFEIDFKP